MIPLIVIASIAAIIIIIKKLFDTSENTGSSSYHNSEPPLYNIEPTTSKSTNTQQSINNNHSNTFLSSAIKQVEICDSSEISTAQRKEICNNIISKYSDSSDPLDHLAVAIAHKHLGASHRKQAIEYYEMYLEKPVRIPNKTDMQWNAANWMIHSDLAKLYESEYEYDKSIKMLEECISLNKKEVQLSGYGFNPADYTRIGTLIMKRDGTAAAIAYYEDLKKSEVYNKDRAWFDNAYNDVIEKHNRGYVYRPRKSKNQ